MTLDLEGASAAAFGIFNLLRLVSYFPQILVVARDKSGASAISISCWMIWFAANASTALYAAINLGDMVLLLTSLFNAVCCMTVILLALHNRVAVRRPPAAASA